MSNMIVKQYEGHSVRFNDQGYLNATEIASRYGKDVRNWTKTEETAEYIHELNQLLSNASKNTHLELIVSKRGNQGGTWLHPKLAVQLKWSNEVLTTLGGNG